MTEQARGRRRGKGRGGARPGAGRPPGPRAWVLHRERQPIPGHCPVHVTLRVRQGVPSLRRPPIVREFLPSLALASDRGGFRVVLHALESDRVHLIVEAKGRDALSRGMKSVAARLGRAVNRACARSGPVLDGRYRIRLLHTPAEVDAALAGLARLGGKPLTERPDLSRPHTRLLRTALRRASRDAKRPPSTAP